MVGNGTYGQVYKVRRMVRKCDLHICRALLGGVEGSRFLVCRSEGGYGRCQRPWKGREGERKEHPGGEALLMPLPACLSAEPVPEVVGTGQKPGRVACSSESRQKGIRPCVSELSWDSERAKA